MTDFAIESEFFNKEVDKLCKEYLDENPIENIKTYPSFSAGELKLFFAMRQLTIKDERQKKANTADELMNEINELFDQYMEEHRHYNVFTDPMSSKEQNKINIAMHQFDINEQRRREFGCDHLYSSPEITFTHGNKHSTFKCTKCSKILRL